MTVPPKNYASYNESLPVERGAAGRWAILALAPRNKRDVVVLLLQRGKEAIVNPSQDEVVSLVDVLIVAGSDDKIETLLIESRKNKEIEDRKHKEED